MGGKQSKAARRREALAEVRDLYADNEFGILLENVEGRLRLSWRPETDPLLFLLSLDRLRLLLSELEEEMVLVLRESGESWDDIGLLLGQTGEAVRRRHGAAALLVASAPEEVELDG